MFRKALFWMHLSAGVSAGLIILMMSVTGVILTYERQMQVWEDGPYYTDPEPGQQRLTVDQLLAAANQTEGFTATSVILNSAADAPFVARAGRSQTQYLNPYTAEIYDPHSDSLSAFFSDVRSLHRWFLVTGDGRATARDITGAANLLFLFLLLSGTYLWLPKVINWATLKTRIWFNPQVNNSQARDFNWHHVFAFWAAIPLLVIIPTASVFNYGWANNLVYTLAGDTPPQRSPAVTPDPSEEPTQVQSLESLFNSAQAYKEDWRTISISLPQPGSQSISIAIDEGNGGQPQLRHSLSLDRASGTEVSWVPFTDQSSGVQARRWVRFLHTGEALGLTGQTIAGLASAAGAVLVWTGLALALRRFLRWRARTRKAVTETGSSSELAT
ncbi:MAG: PepSY domain-containing protein [Pseudomonadales bacterium]|nr:PepSY domain-containing protein [Pseudomonadales bacterium]